MATIVQSPALLVLPQQRKAMPGLAWLPAPTEFDSIVGAAKGECDPTRRLQILRPLCHTHLDFLQCAIVDRVIARALREAGAGTEPSVPRVRLAVLASSSTEHLIPSIRVAGLRRGFALDIHAGEYGQARQDLLSGSTALADFRPDYVLIALHSQAIVPQLSLRDEEAADRAVAAAMVELRALWRAARDRFGAVPIQQTVLDLSQPLFGLAEVTLRLAPASVIRRLNAAIAAAAGEEHVLLLDMDRLAQRVGLGALTDPTRWHQAKQEVAPSQAPLYGDAVARLVMAARGLSRKCLVLDLDNTLWGGVIGDDGLEGIRIGQGSAEGEAYAAFQLYVKRLAERGVILAVSSKNDPAVALEAFERHPEMVLGQSDIAVFEAGWDDKPAALQRIARKLALGLDALVLFDDNPAERALARDTLPEVAVPEAPVAPEAFAQCLADSGWFEAVAFTAEDALRTGHYRGEAQRREAAETSADIDTFLDGLAMELRIAPVDGLTLQRAAQLINKTNQFNLTTRRSSAGEMAAFAADPERTVLAARLSDRFGDSGLISVAVGRMARGAGEPTLDIETWVMSCRVLGRRVEFAMRDALAEAARRMGARWMIGHYRPTQRNGLVADLYAQLGFDRIGGDDAGGTDWRLELDGDLPRWRSPFAVASS